MGDLPDWLQAMRGRREEPQRRPIVDPQVTARLRRDFGGDAFGQMGRDFRSGFNSAAENVRQTLPRGMIGALADTGIPGWQGLRRARSDADVRGLGLDAPSPDPAVDVAGAVSLPQERPQERPPANAPRWLGPNRQLGATWEPPTSLTGRRPNGPAWTQQSQEAAATGRFRPLPLGEEAPQRGLAPPRATEMLTPEYLARRGLNYSFEGRYLGGDRAARSSWQQVPQPPASAYRRIEQEDSIEDQAWRSAQARAEAAVQAERQAVRRRIPRPGNPLIAQAWSDPDRRGRRDRR